MADVPLDNVVVHFDADGVDAPPIRVLDKLRDHMGDDRYLATWGADERDFSRATPDQKMTMLLAQFIYLTVEQGIEPKVVHQAFGSIPEYRDTLRRVGCSDLLRSPARPA